MFDISMEIIDQRIKNINRSVRLNRSVSESDICVDDHELSSTNIASVAKSTPQLDKSDTEQQTEIITTTNEQLSSSSSSSGEIVVVTTSKPTKRKLFAPPSYFNYADVDLTPKKTPIKLNKTPANKTDKKLNTTSTKTVSTEKRIREDSRDELTDIFCGPSTAKKLKQDKKMIGNSQYLRRSSSAAFQPDKPKVKPPILSKAVVAQETSASATANATKRKLPFMVYTNMHQQQIKIVKEVGKF